MHYYQFNIKTYLASTTHLSDGEDLAYRRLIDYYYDTELPIPTALPVLCRRLRLALPDVEAVLNEFFTHTVDGWKHGYIEHEIAAYQSFIARQKANGSKGGRGRKPSAKPKEPSAKPTINNKQLTINNKPTKDNGFALFWLAYPNTQRKGSKTKCEEVWVKKKLHLDKQKIIDHVESQKITQGWLKDDGQYVPAPLTYLNQRRWDGAIEAEVYGGIMAGAI